jgi:hypothetical protein
MRLGSRGLLGFLALPLVSACGPTPEQSGAAVLLVAPVAIGVTALIVRLFVWLWRPVERLPISSRPALFAAAGGAVIGVPLALCVDGVGELLLIALALFGTSYLAIALVFWRIWLALDRASASTWSFVPVASLLVAPALPLALGLVGADFADFVSIVWVFPGYLGIVPLVLIAALTVEVLVRRGRARRASAGTC